MLKSIDKVKEAGWIRVCGAVGVCVVHAVSEVSAIMHYEDHWEVIIRNPMCLHKLVTFCSINSTNLQLLSFLSREHFFIKFLFDFV